MCRGGGGRVMFIPLSGGPDNVLDGEMSPIMTHRPDQSTDPLFGNFQSQKPWVTGPMEAKKH